MDSTLFIRSRRVLTLWLVVPALVAVAVELGSRAFYNYQQGSSLRKQSLDRVVPEMIMAGEEFNQFAAGYQISTEGSSSIESSFIELLNTAADAAQFKITSIKLTQERGASPDAVKVIVTVDGTGLCGSLVAFLQNVKNQDPLIYEEQMEITRSYEDSDILQAEISLGKVYLENEGKSL